MCVALVFSRTVGGLAPFVLLLFLSTALACALIILYRSPFGTSTGSYPVLLTSTSCHPLDCNQLALAPGRRAGSLPAALRPEHLQAHESPRPDLATSPTTPSAAQNGLWLSPWRGGFPPRSLPRRAHRVRFSTSGYQLARLERDGADLADRAYLNRGEVTFPPCSGTQLGDFRAHTVPVSRVAVTSGRDSGTATSTASQIPEDLILDPQYATAATRTTTSTSTIAGWDCPLRDNDPARHRNYGPQPARPRLDRRGPTAPATSHLPAVHVHPLARRLLVHRRRGRGRRRRRAVRLDSHAAVHPLALVAINNPRQPTRDRRLRGGGGGGGGRGGVGWGGGWGGGGVVGGGGGCLPARRTRDRVDGRRGVEGTRTCLGSLELQRFT